MLPALKCEILTLFPEMAKGYLLESMIGRAIKEGLLDICVHSLRDWATDKHHTTDDRPYGGGAGMLLMPEPIFLAIESLRQEETLVVYMAPDGEKLTSKIAAELAAKKHLIFLSGHYEGVDQRVRDHLIDREISIGDYVLTNGTLPALVTIDAIARYVPGVLGEEKSLTQDSFMNNLLTFPQYTRPADFRGYKVPEVLLSGDHQAIARWREEQQLNKTRALRPDILSKDKQS